MTTIATAKLPKVRVDYTTYGKTVGLLTKRVERLGRRREYDRKWTYVIGFENGGLPAAVHISKHLGLPLHTVRPDGAGSDLFSAFEDFFDEVPLFVDDIYDTGKTAKRIMEWWNHNKDRKQVTPDDFAFVYARFGDDSFKPTLYGARLYANQGWVTFPWEPSAS